MPYEAATLSCPPRPAPPPQIDTYTLPKFIKGTSALFVKDKSEEDTAVKEELNIEEPWRGPGARTRARVSDARSPGHTPTHTI